MSPRLAADLQTPLRSVCVFCSSSNAAPPAYLAAAEDFGQRLAAAQVRLVYGGGGVGLMGSVARAAHAGGGSVLGVMPAFLRRQEMLFDAVETVVVETMHERKRVMFDQSDAFAVLPGGVGTLEEVVELMSWRRLDLHRKPIVFLNLDNFWRPLFELLAHTVEARLSPAWLADTWAAVSSTAEILPAIHRLRAIADDGPGFLGYPDAPHTPG